MATSFVMPKLGLTMEAGKVVKWLVDDGENVAPGQAVLLIETDKVESEVEAVDGGVLRHLADVGSDYACGEQIGWLLEPGEEPPAVAAPAAPAAAPTIAAGATAAPVATKAAAVVGDGGRLLASPNAKRVAKDHGVDIRTVAGTGPGGRITSEDVIAAAGASAAAAARARQAAPPTTMNTAAGSTVLASTAARQLAELIGIDLSQVASTGTDPRIQREDVATHIRNLLAASTGAAPAAAPAMPLSQQPSKLTPMSGMRGTIASRMSDSLATMAQLTLHMNVDMDAVVQDRSQRATNGTAPGYTDYVIAAVAGALADHPYVNSQVTDDGVAELPAINVGMAVALDEGLIVPVVHDTPNRSLDELAAETTRLATAARDRKLTLAELEGGTFSVTALGMFDVDGFTPIINAPNTAILGVGRLRVDTDWSDGDTPKPVKRLTLSLTWDHRAFDGAPAAEFTRSIKRRLEQLDL